MFLLTCLYASATLALLATGATNELLGTWLTSRRRRRPRRRPISIQVLQFAG